jgi:lipopolysaccharide/colanic/teichoic acid biosynthesis glycosyltransferase
MTFKYLFDRLFALLGIIILSPVVLVVAILVRAKIGNPVLFRQERVGKDGKLFTIWKFRTMEDENEGSSVCVAGDERILPWGVKLRKYKLDELPQLWNVLKGDMSFVGPRPDVPGYADKLEGDDRDVLKLRPGITGPATLKYRNEEELLATVDNPQEYNDTVIFPDKVRINCYYLHHYSFWMDIRMIFCTVLGKKMEYAGEVI